MAAESDCDRASFLDPEDFGVCVRAPNGHFEAIFDADDQQTLVGDNEMVFQGPQFIAPTKEITRVALVDGDEVTIGTSRYRVTHFLDDGTGMTRVMLHAA